MAHAIRHAALVAALAATTVMSAPVSASAVPVAGSVPQGFATSRYDLSLERADYHCRWRCGGWGGGWGGGWRRDRIDAGDVVLGAAVVGGIIAIASAANRRERDRDVIVYDRDPNRDGEWVRRGERRPRPIGTAATGATSGLDNAVSMCLDRIEPDGRVADVDNVRRDASGWEVTGTLARGQGFRCRIGNDGRVDAIDYDPGRAAGDSDGQWSTDAYVAARQGLGGTVRPDLAVQETSVAPARGPVAAAPRSAATTAAPAYPGGPIPGEEIPENPPEPVPGG